MKKKIAALWMVVGFIICMVISIHCLSSMGGNCFMPSTYYNNMDLETTIKWSWVIYGAGCLIGFKLIEK